MKPVCCGRGWANDRRQTERFAIRPTQSIGETALATGNASEVARIEILRNTEPNSVIAVLTHMVMTPMRPAALEAEKRPAARRPPTRTVGGNPMPIDTDDPTSLGLSPKYATCEPYTFGMRLAEPVTDPNSKHKYRYPVAQAYTDAMQALLTFGIEWPEIPGAKEPFLPAGRERLREMAKPTGLRMGWPMSADQKSQFLTAVLPIVTNAMQATAFGLPKGQTTPGMVLFDGEDGKSASGKLDYKFWQLEISPSLIESICKAREASSRDAGLALLAATLYHEARHAQQFFWMLAMVKQFPDDFPGLRELHHLFPAIFSKNIPKIAANTPVPEEHSARISIKRMTLGYYYALLIRQIEDLEKASDENVRLENYQTELAVCEKQVAEVLSHVGRNGRAIDYRKLPQNGPGYRIRPWEDDAFACDFVVGQLWFARDLPEPDRCNRFYDLREGERPDAGL